jgi:hypothetical protein
MRYEKFNVRLASGRRWLRRSLGPALGAALVALSVSTPGFADDSALQAKYNLGEPVAANAVAQLPESYLGKRIIVEGYVDDIRGPGLFEVVKRTVSEERQGVQKQHEHDLLVFIPAGGPSAAVEKGKEITVVGVLHKGVEVEIENHADLDLDRRPVLMAEAVEFD